MSGQPPKKPGASEPPKVSRKVSSVLEAIPTEDEGDALFDELFGSVFEDAAEEDSTLEERVGEARRAGVPESSAAPPPVAAQELTDEILEEDEEELVTERPPSDHDFSPDNGGPTLGEQAALEGSDVVPEDEIYDADDLVEPTPEEPIEFDQPVLPAKGPPTVSSIDFAAAIRPEAEPLAATDRVAAEEIESSRPEESSAQFRAPRPRVPPPPPPRGAPPRVPPPPPPRPPVAPPRPGPPSGPGSRPVAPPREELDTIDLGEDRDTTVGPLGDAVVMAIPHEFSDVARGPELVTETGAKLGGTSFDPEAPHGEAVQLMVRADEREAWVERARWLYSEAPADPQSRADTLLVVSELFAMAGEDEQAELVAREALGLAPSSPLAHRQLRSLLMARDRWIEVCDALDAEARVAPTPLAKLHALYLGSEVSRLVLGDAEAAGRRLDHAERALGDDVRPQLARLMRALASADEVPEANFRGEATEPFTRALDALRNVRSDGAEGQGDGTPHAHLLQARGALRRRDVARTIGALADLQTAELAAGVAWLTAALAAPYRELRGAAVDALTRVSEGSHGPLAMRALATRALEAGDLESAFRVVANAAEEVLAPAERLAIASLNGRTLMDLQTLLEEALAAGEHAPLAAAASAVLVSPMSGSSSIRTVGEPLPKALVMLGRELAACALASTTQRISRNEVLDAQPLDSSVEEGISPALRHRANEVVEIDPSHGAARAVLLEDAYVSRDVARVAKAVLESSETAGGLERERALASALLSEIAGDPAQMVADAQRALTVAADDEAAARMVAAAADPVVGAASLVRFGEASSDVARSALAFTEAGLRLMEVEGEEFEGESLLRRAAAAQADIPIAAFIGMYVTRAMGDAEGEAFWLEQRRSASNEAVDRVPDLIRQALAMPAEDSATRASLLEEAHRARPYDYTLRELYEQTAGEVEDRPRWLMDQATQGVVGAAAMALEAAYAYELAGDLEHAAEAATRAASGGDRLAPVFAERYAQSGHGTDAVLESLLERLRQAKDDAERLDLRMLIGRIELARGHWSQAIDAFRAVADQAPDDLIALHALESLLLVQGDHQGLDEVALAVARATEGPTAVAQSALAARLRYGEGRWNDAYDAVAIAFAQKPPGIWALRHMAAHAEARKEWETVGLIDRDLAEQTESPVEKATLLLRAAEASQALGDENSAAELLAGALEQWPRHPIALLERAALLERSGSANEAAEAFEELALVCQAPRHKAAMLYRAATRWLSLSDAIGRAEGRRLLEAVVEVDPSYEDAFQRLQEIYLAAGAKRELAELMAARLERVTEPEERLRLEILRGKVLAEAGSASEARAALSAALEAEPDNADALLAYADVSAAEEDWEEVEAALVRVGRLVSTPDKQVPIYLRLGNLYDKHLPNLERAEQAYQQVLKLQPDNATAGDKLVDLAMRAGQTDRAFEQQHALVEASTSAQEKCLRTVRLAELQEQAGNTKEAEQTLLKARRAWPRETAPTAALYHFYKRIGQVAGADTLLERAQTEVRRGLAAGRFEPQLFSMAAMVAEIREQHDAAELARATLAAIEGEPGNVEGAGVLAAQPELDEYLAPEVFSPAFRSLLLATGGMMDHAVPFDLSSLRARPLPANHADVHERTREIAAGYGLPDVQVFATSALGETCVPARAEPPTLCFGLSLVAYDRADVREFLIHRALKILQTKTAALSRTAPIDLWPLLAAYLKIHSPSFNPPGVDAARLTAFIGSMKEVAPGALNPQIGMLASEVISNIGNRASTLNTMANTWGSRAALLATGDLNVGLTSVALAHGVSEGPPASGPERMRWIGRHAEARELIVFAMSDGYAKARVQLGVANIEMIEAVPLSDEE